MKAKLDAIAEQSIRENREIFERAEAQAAKIMGVSGRQNGASIFPTSHGNAISIEDAIRIASHRWAKDRNRGKSGFNGALEALREVGLSPGTTPNRERPQFNDIVLMQADGRRCVLTICTSTWEFVVRPD